MREARTEFDWSVIFRALLCLFLGSGFVLFVRNNDLLRHGFPVLANPEVPDHAGTTGRPFPVRRRSFDTKSVDPPAGGDTGLTASRDSEPLRSILHPGQTSRIPLAARLWQ